MENAEEKEVSEEDVEPEIEEENPETEGDAEEEKETKVDPGELLEELATNDIQVEMVWNPDESETTATIKRTGVGFTRYQTAVGLIGAFILLAAVNLILQTSSQIGMSIMIGALGGIFGNIANEIVGVSRSVAEIIPTRNK